MTISIASLDEPVKTIRRWTYGLAPNPDGTDADYVEMTCQPGSDLPSQWTVVRLSDGARTVQRGPAGVYANSNFGAGGAHGGDQNQLRGPRGEIYFLLQNPLGPEMRLALFEPLTRRVYQLSTLVDHGSPDALTYSATFDASGSKLYLGGQSAHGRAPIVWSIDTATMDVDVLGHVGAGSTVTTTYARYLAADRGHLYVAVGELPFQLVSINLATKVATTLMTTSGPGRQWIEFEARAPGWAAHVYGDPAVTDGTATRHWLADGALYPYVDGVAPTFDPRGVAPYVNPLPANTPQIDASRGAGVVLTRPAGSTGAWREIAYDVADEVPVPIESLAALPDGTLIGNAQQYGGFFRVRADATEWYGAWRSVSQPCHVVVGDKLYFAGYPNGALYVFDPALPWDVDVNPALLGNFHAASSMKYASFLRESGGALYCAGLCQRDAVGSAIGRYDLVTRTFTGSRQDLDTIVAPRGFVVLADLDMVVLGGFTLQGIAVIARFDAELVELSRARAPLDGFSSTGEIYRTSTPTVLLGLAPNAAYRYDVDRCELLETIPIGAPTACAQAPDGMVWYVSASKRLKMIDPNSLLVVDVADLSAYEAVRAMTWSGPELYLAAGATMLRVSGL